MPFSRDNTLIITPEGDEVKDGIVKLDDDMTKIYIHVNTVNTTASQKISQTEKGSINGVCPLDNNSKVPVANLPDDSLPLYGEIRMFAGETCPDGWWECIGAEYNVADHPKTFEAIGYLWGGSGLTFRTPDFRGWIPRGWDHGAGVDPDAATRSGGDHVGSSQQDTIRKHIHPTGANTGKAQGGETVVDPGSYGTYQHMWTTDFGLTDAQAQADYGATAMLARGAETRPKNKYVMFIIRHD